GALVAVALDPGDPFRIDDAGAHDAGDFLLQRARERAFGAGMVVVPGGGAAAGEGFGGGDEATLELVVVVAIEQVVLAIVLVVDDGLDVGEAGGEALALGHAGGLRAIGVLAPVEEGFGEIGLALPIARIHQALQAGAVSPWL